MIRWRHLLLRSGRLRLRTARTGTLALLTRTNLLVAGAFALRLVRTSNRRSGRLLAAILLGAFLIVALLLPTSGTVRFRTVGASALALLATTDRSISTT